MAYSLGEGGLASSLLDTAAKTGSALQPVPCLSGAVCSLHLIFFSLKIIQLIIRLQTIWLIHTTVAPELVLCTTRDALNDWH